MEEFLIRKETLEAMADKIRSKTGREESMTPGQMQELIGSLADTSSVTAGAEDVLAGKAIVDGQGNVVAGTMPDNGKVTGVIGSNCTSHRIPKGYHDGTGAIYAATVNKEVTPTREQQVIAASHNILGDYSYGYNNGITTQVLHFLNRVTVHPIPEIYQDVSGVTANAEDVLEGKVFVDAQGNEVVGTRKADALVPDEVTLLKMQEITGFAMDPQMGAYTPGYDHPAAFLLEEGKTYRVNWDGVDYLCMAFGFLFQGYTCIAIGNAVSLGLQGNGEPFLIVQNFSADTTQIFSTDASDCHTVGIYTEASGTGDTTQNMIWGSTSDGTAESLAGNGIIRYVTFKNHDGTVEYGRKSVITGDDCIDPVAGGFLETPVRESTAQHSFTYAGWESVPNGGLDANALKNVIDDRTVYANFVSAVRYYTITFYDSDGTTVLATKSVAYGSVPSYTPTKEAYNHAGWNPTPVAVTGPASYSAVWVEKPAFATTTWAKIKEVCDAGLHTSTFAIGDKKPVTLTYEDGTSETIDFTIVAMDVDTRNDDTKAALTLMADHLVRDSLKVSSYEKSMWPMYRENEVKTFITKIYNALPADLQAVLPTVRRDMLERADTKIFIPDAYNLDGKTYNDDHDVYNVPQKTQYPYFANGASIVRTKLNDAASDDYWVHSIKYRGGSGGSYYYFYAFIDGNTVSGGTSGQRLDQGPHGFLPCFCI